MTLLLDTHIFLWALLSPDKLNTKIKKILNDPDNKKFLSAASSWEIAIKYSRGNLILAREPKRFVVDYAIEAGIILLPISVNDTLAVSDLPHHHKDPFDRLLVVQAKFNDLKLVTSDKIFKKYKVDVVWL